MDVPEATTPPVSSGVRFLGIARGKLRNQEIRGSASIFLIPWILQGKAKIAGSEWLWKIVRIEVDGM